MSVENEIQPINEVEESKKFPSVITTSSLFGMDEGTRLKFDFSIGKYVSVVESEDIGPGESYFYSGSAVALDPYLVKQSIGESFEYSGKEVPGSNPDDVEKDKSELKTVEESSTITWDVADLCVACDQCGTITKIDTIQKGVQFVMSTTSDSTIELVCPVCESKMTLFYENGRMFTEEELDNLKEEKENESQKESTE